MMYDISPSFTYSGSIKLARYKNMCDLDANELSRQF